MFMGGWVCRCMFVLMYEYMYACMQGCMYERMYAWVDGVHLEEGTQVLWVDGAIGRRYAGTIVGQRGPNRSKRAPATIGEQI